MKKITFLGTGTSQGVPVINCHCDVCRSTDVKDKRLRSSISIVSPSKNIIIDVGPDFRYQMLRNPIDRLDAVLLTHEHNDHVAGMDDLRPFNFLQDEDIPIYACDRVLNEIKTRFYYAFMEKSYPGAPGYALNKLKTGQSFMLGAIKITAFEVMHGRLPILCYRLDDFVYITDAKTISEDSMNIISGCEIMVVNALRKENHWSHMTLEEALILIDRVKPKKAYLTHMSHLIGKHSDISKELPENVFFAYDGLIIESS